MSRRLTLFVCSLSVLAGAHLLSTLRVSESQSLVSPTTAAAKMDANAPRPIVPDPANPNPQTIDPPTREAIRTDAQADPHELPVAILEFASRLAPRMKQAFQSAAQAERFLAELEDCVKNSGDQHSSDPSPTIRAICLSNARALADRYPKLNARLEQLNREVDLQVTRLLETAEEAR